MSVCNVVSKQNAMKAIWDSDLIEIYKLWGAKVLSMALKLIEYHKTIQMDRI